MVELGPLLAPPARPVVELGGFPIELLFMDDPVVVPVVAEPPVVEPPLAVPPLLCASANVLESASAPANAIVMSFMVVSLVDDPEKTSTGNGCSSVVNTKTSTGSAGDGADRKISAFRSRGEPAKRFTTYHQLRPVEKQLGRKPTWRLASGAPYFPSVGRMRIFHRFQMRSSTMKLILSPFSPSPGVR
jgi:hypothetical protein